MAPHDSETIASAEGVALVRADAGLRLGGNVGAAAVDTVDRIHVTISCLGDADVGFAVFRAGYPSATPIHEQAFRGPDAGETALAAMRRVVEALGPALAAAGAGLAPGVVARTLHNGRGTGLCAKKLPERVGGLVLLEGDGGVEPVRPGDDIVLEDAGGSQPLPLRILLRGRLFHAVRGEDGAGPLDTYATVKTLLLRAAQAAGARLAVPQAMTADRLRVLAAAGRLDEALERLLAEVEFDGESWGARLIAEHDGVRAWRLPDDAGGRVLLDVPPRLCLLGPGDELHSEYGGMSAAIGVVPLSIERVRPDGRVETLVAEDVDEQVTGVDSRQILAAWERFFERVCASAGCRFGP